MKKLLYSLVALMVGCATVDAPEQVIDKDVLDEAQFDQTVQIDFADQQTNITADSRVNVTSDGAHVVVSVSDTTVCGVRIVLSGKSDDGGVKIYGDMPVLLDLGEVQLTSQRGAPINCQSKKRMWVRSESSVLSDAAKYTAVEGEDCKGALFSEGQIILWGDNGPKCEIVARGGHGIASDDYIRVMGGHWFVRSAKDGMHANDNIRMDDGFVSIDAASDGVECKEGSVELYNGELEIRCVDDGISASRPKEKKKKDSADSTVVAKPKKDVRANVVVDMREKYSVVEIRTTGPKGAGIKADDDIVIRSAVDVEVSGDASKCLNAGKCVLIESTAFGGARLVASGGVLYDKKKNDTSSPKGIKADSLLWISGGDIYVEATKAGEGVESKKQMIIDGGSIRVKAMDDALNAGSSLVINNGEMVFYSLFNDGVDSNGTIEINGGEVTAYGAGVPEAGFDCDFNRFAINGGVIMGAGGMTSAPTEGACTQPSVIIQNVELPITAAIGYDGTAWREPTDTLMCVPTSKYGTLLLSNPDMKAGEEYLYESSDSTYTVIPSMGHQPMMPPPPPGGFPQGTPPPPFDGKMPPMPKDMKGFPPPPPPGAMPEGMKGFPPPPPAAMPQGGQTK